MSEHKRTVLKTPISLFVILLALTSKVMNLFQGNLIDKLTCVLANNYINRG